MVSVFFIAINDVYISIGRRNIKKNNERKEKVWQEIEHEKPLIKGIQVTYLIKERKNYGK
jgi:hypothetical protein